MQESKHPSFSINNKTFSLKIKCSKIKHFYHVIYNWLKILKKKVFQHQNEIYENIFNISGEEGH